MREKHKPCLLSHLHAPGQSQCKVAMIVGLYVSDSYTYCWTQPPHPSSNAERGFQMLLDDPTSTSSEAY